MTPEEFLEQLNPYSKVFDLSVDYKYTEEQLVLFAKLYHENELKKLRVADVSGRSELLVNFLTWYVHNSDYGKIGEPIKAIVDDFIKLTNCH